MPVKVSVIVPVYNAAATLPACLGNLVHQTLSDIEIILIDDASTDGSLPILFDCERSFPDKVILIPSDKNRGPGGARNLGLSYASGEYIGFVDSDDIPDISMYEKLYLTATSGGYDIVDGAFYHEEKNILHLFTPDDCLGELNAQKRSTLISGGGYLWSKLFHRNLFTDLSFRENTILEDMEVLMLLFKRAKTLGSIKDTLYKYCYYPSSASKITNPTRYHQAVRDAMGAVYNTLSGYLDYPNIQTAVEYAIIHLYLNGIINILQQIGRAHV